MRLYACLTNKYCMLALLVMIQFVAVQKVGFAQKIKMQGTPHKFDKRQGNGLLAEYEAKGDNIVKSYNAIDAQINFAWDTASSQYAAPNIDVLDFTAKWLGGVYAPKAGKYTFVVEGDDGVRLFLNEYPLIDEWQEQAKKTFSQQVTLKGEQIYDLRLEYIQISGGTATIALKWKFENDSLSVIPQKYLFSDYNRRPQQPMVTIEHEEAKPVQVENEFEDLIKKRKITLQHISFEKGSTKLIQESFEELDKLAQSLKTNASIKIELAGHTDNVGSESANVRLSKLRAVAVANYLIKKGIDEKRIVTTGYGSKEPITENISEEGRIQNRRVELRIIN
jgi:outer membrane protein OmpA-like peptidoglycan-associated protein